MVYRIALAQVETHERKERNLERGIELIRSARDSGAELLILPELFMAYAPLNSPPSRLASLAEEVEGEFIEALSLEAKACRIHLAVGIIERSGKKNKVYNTIVLIDRDGRMIATHRKLQLFDSFGYKESLRFEAASDIEGAFETKLGKMGLMTCYELRFPEIARILTMQGAQLLVVPTAWVAGRMKEEHLHTLAKARALENTVYVAVASQTGRIFTGRSVVVDPFGVPILDAGEAEGLVVTEIDPNRISNVRRSLPSLGQVRADVYRKHLYGS